MSQVNSRIFHFKKRRRRRGRGERNKEGKKGERVERERDIYLREGEKEGGE